VVEVGESLHHGCQLLASDAIISLRLGKLATVVGYHILLAIFELRQDRTDTFLTGVCV